MKAERESFESFAGDISIALANRDGGPTWTSDARLIFDSILLALPRLNPCGLVLFGVLISPAAVLLCPATASTSSFTGLRDDRDERLVLSMASISLEKDVLGDNFVRRFE